MAQLTLHIGAHRTATNSLQATLRRLFEAGKLGDMAYFGPYRLRPRFSVTMLGISKAPTLARAIPLRLLSRDLAAALRSDQPVLYSEEASLGRVDATLLKGRGLYPTAAAHLQALHTMLGVKNARVVLSVRSPAAWYPSAYAMASLRRKLPPIETLAPQWAAAERGWHEIAHSVRDIFGSCEIFQYETLRDSPTALIAALVGSPVNDIRMPHTNQSHSADVIQKIAAERSAGRKATRAVANAFQSAAPNAAAHRLALPTDIAGMMEARYQAELSAMRANKFQFINPTP
ncbi:MAG: hypothetical protein ACPGVA_13660 [Pikeienuella sp.]